MAINPDTPTCKFPPHLFKPQTSRNVLRVDGALSAKKRARLLKCLTLSKNWDCFLIYIVSTLAW
jgi:hypothetical protein